jgi:hypothetical protein
MDTYPWQKKQLQQGQVQKEQLWQVQLQQQKVQLPLKVRLVLWIVLFSIFISFFFFYMTC